MIDLPGLISHVGIAVENLDKAIRPYAVLTGDSKPIIEEVRDQKVRVAIFSGSDGGLGGRIELLAPTADDSPIAGFLKKHGAGLHHICVYVKDLDAKLRELKDAKVRLIDETPRIGAEGKRIAFVHPAGMNGVLIELEELPPES